MRDFVSCFSEYAVQISDNASCSSHSTTSCNIPSSAAIIIPSAKIAVTSLYKSLLSNHRQILISITWSKSSSSSSSSHTLIISFNNDPIPFFKLTTSASRLFKKLKGSKSFELHSSKIEVFWDLSSAKYGSGPEPIGNYYLIITIDSESGLTLGDPTQEAVINDELKFNTSSKFSLVSRQEHLLGNTLYSTRARFRDAGEEHEISIRCNGEDEGIKHPALSVSVDEKMVILVKRLQWNFRGNQTIFLDGLLVDMMWDLHDWFCDNNYNNNNNSSSNSYSGLGSYGVFMFKTRSGLDSRLWLEEDKNKNGLIEKDCQESSKLEFALMIYACKNS